MYAKKWMGLSTLWSHCTYNWIAHFIVCKLLVPSRRFRCTSDMASESPLVFYKNVSWRPWCLPFHSRQLGFFSLDVFFQRLYQLLLREYEVCHLTWGEKGWTKYRKYVKVFNKMCSDFYWVKTIYLHPILCTEGKGKPRTAQWASLAKLPGLFSLPYHFPSRHTVSTRATSPWDDGRPITSEHRKGCHGNRVPKWTWRACAEETAPHICVSCQDSPTR